MAATNYVVVYSSVTGFVSAMFLRTTSDNVATWKTDEYLEVDGTRVLMGVDGVTSDIQAIVIANPTAVDVQNTGGSHEVDVATAPTDVTERGSGSTGRGPLYPYAS